MAYAPGIRENLRPFLEQLLQVFFVGLTIGLQRTVIPALAETEFGVAQGSMTAIFGFIVSFGIVKGAMNFVSGRVSEQAGRHRVLIWGWLAASRPGHVPVMQRDRTIPRQARFLPSLPGAIRHLWPLCRPAV